jgi:hypothetical protein
MNFVDSCTVERRSVLSRKSLFLCEDVDSAKRAGSVFVDPSDQTSPVESMLALFYLHKQLMLVSWFFQTDRTLEV